MSLSDEKGSTPAQVALNEIYEHYEEDEFIGLAVTDSGKTGDCIHTFEDTISGGLQFVSKVGQLYSMAVADPFTWIGSSLLSEFAEGGIGTRKSSVELIKFAKNTDGYVFDICKPHYGKALAYSILQKMNIEERFPEECRGPSYKRKKEPHLQHALNRD